MGVSNSMNNHSPSLIQPILSYPMAHPPSIPLHLVPSPPFPSNSPSLFSCLLSPAFLSSSLHLSFPSFVRFPHLQRPSFFSSLPLFSHYLISSVYSYLIQSIPTHITPHQSPFCSPNESASPRIASPPYLPKQALNPNAYRGDSSTANHSITNRSRKA